MWKYSVIYVKEFWNLLEYNLYQMSDISSINNGKWDTEASTQDYEQPIEKTYEHIFF